MIATPKNTGVDDPVDGKYNDHSHAIMGVIPMPGLGKASLDIPPAVGERMRHTATHDSAHRLSSSSW